MSFASPALLTSLALVPVYVWLRLRQRRPPVAVVSSLLLWKSVPPAPLEALAQRERLWNLVLLFEGLSLALVCLALAQPFVVRQTTRPVHLVLAIDDSASMGAGDRWSRAIARANELVGKLSDDDVVTLLTNSREEPRITPLEASMSLWMLSQRPEEDDLDGLLVRARALAGAEEGTVVRILTDRAVPDAPEVESFGGPVDNAGIVAASYDGREVFALVAATSPRRLTLQASMIGLNQPTADVAIVDRSPVPVLVPVRGGDPFSISLTTKDDLASDDGASVQARRRLRVRIDTPGNPELVRALTVLDGVELVYGASGEADLVVLDRTWPGEVPKAPCVVIAPPAGCPLRGASVGGPIATWESSDPLLEGLDSQAVGLTKAIALSTDEREFRALATAGDGAVLAVRRTDGVPLLYVGFDVSSSGGESTWATHPHFPIFWYYIIDRFVGGPSLAWSCSGLLSRKETLCAGLSTPARPVDFARTRVVSSPRFWTPYALAAAALGFSLAFLLARKANGWRSSSSSTTR